MKRNKYETHLHNYNLSFDELDKEGSSEGGEPVEVLTGSTSLSTGSKTTDTLVLPDLSSKEDDPLLVVVYVD